MIRGIRGLIVAALFVAVGGVSVYAATFNSTNFTVDGTSGGNFSGGQSSTSYGLASVGGESVVGGGAGGSYKLGEGYTSSLERSMQLTLQPSGLKAYYSMNEGTGTTAHDSSANTTYASFTGTSAWASGKLSNAVQTNGTTSYLTVPSDANNNIGTMTLSAWIKTSQVPGATVSVIEKRASGSGAYPYAMRMTTGGIIQCSSGDGTSTSTVSTTVAVNSNQWRHIVCTRQPSGVNKIFLDGDFQNQASPSLGTTTNSSAVGIGARADGAQFFSGSIDELQIYDSILGDDEVLALHDSVNLGKNSGISLGSLTATASNTSDFESIVQTDAPGYSLAVQQDGNLRKAGTGATSDFAQNFDSFGDGTTLTTGNTGFSNISCGSATATSSTSSPLHSTFGRAATVASATCILRYDYASTATRYYRTYFRAGSYPAATTSFLNLRGTGAIVSGSRIQNDGKIVIRDGVSAVDTSTNAIGINQWARIEYFYNSTASRQTLRLFYGNNVDGLIPDEVLSGSATNGVTDDMQVGIINGTASQNFDFDDVATTTGGWMGPAGTDTIAAIASGTIASPAAWSEGTTKGLGFTLTSAPGLDSKWGSGANYAAFPGSSTSFYTRSGLTAGAKDTIAMRARLDIAATQAAGGYRNTVTVVGTITP